MTPRAWAFRVAVDHGSGVTPRLAVTPRTVGAELAVGGKRYEGQMYSIEHSGVLVVAGVIGLCAVLVLIVAFVTRSGG